MTYPHVHGEISAEERAWLNTIQTQQRDQRRLVLLWAFGAVVAVQIGLLVDHFFAEAVLVTPISAIALWIGRVVGTLTGIGLWACALQRKRHDRFGAAMSLFLFPIAGGCIGNVDVWQVADRVAFSGISGGWTQVIEPIVGVKGGGKNRIFYASIDPYNLGEAAQIQIPEQQYMSLRNAYAGMCIVVDQRHNPEGQVEVRKLPPVVLTGALPQIFPC